MGDRFKFRWGVPEWDVDFTMIPNPVLRQYSTVPWINQDDEEGIGITNQEMMFIIHLASFRYESAWTGPARPSLATTIRKRMGYAQPKSATKLKEALVHKGLLKVTEIKGWPHEYDLTPFSLAIRSMKP